MAQACLHKHVIPLMNPTLGQQCTHAYVLIAKQTCKGAAMHVPNSTASTNTVLQCVSCALFGQVYTPTLGKEASLPQLLP